MKRLRRFLLIAALPIVVASWQPSISRAAVRTWDANGANPPSGIWGNNANWDVAVPGTADSAAFNLVNTYTVTFNAAPTAIQGLNMFNANNATFTSSGGAKTLNINSGGSQNLIVNSGSSLTLGTTGNPLHANVGGVISIFNGTLNVTSGSQVTTLNLQHGAGLPTLVVDGAGSSLTRTGVSQQSTGADGISNYTFRNSATGDLNGTLVVMNALDNPASVATVNVESNADLSLDSLIVGVSSLAGPTGNVTVTGSGSTITQSGASTTAIGRSSGNGGIINVNSSGTFTTGSGAVSVNTTGAISVAGGIFNANGAVTMANGSTVTINGGVFNAFAGFSNTAGGTLNHRNGNLVIEGGTFAPNAGGAYIINGQIPADLPALIYANGLTNTFAGQLTVASTNKGNMGISDGSTVSSTSGVIASAPGSMGTVNINGIGSRWNANVLTAGNLGNATIGISGGGDLFSANSILASGVGSIANMVVTGANSRFHATSLTVGASGTGFVSIQNDGLVQTSSLNINGVSTVQLDGGTLRYNTISGISRIDFDSGTIFLEGDRTARGILGDPTINQFYSTGVTSTRNLTVGNDFFVDQFFNVDGGVLTVAPDAPGDNLLIGYQNSALMQIRNGGTVNSYRAFLGYNRHPLDGPDGVATVLVTGPGSTWNLQDSMFVGIDDIADPNAPVSSVTIENGGAVHIDGELFIIENSFVTLNGGTLGLDQLVRQTDQYGLTRGTFNFLSGTIQMSGDRNLNMDTTINELFGNQVSAGKNLTVDGIASLTTSFAVNGSTLSVDALANAQQLQLQSGTLNITNQALVVGAAGPLGTALDVNDDMTVNVTLGTTNLGTVTGDGVLGGTFINSATGVLRGDPGKSLTLTGANNTNAGRINLLSGGVEFTQNLTNQAGGLISGNGTLITGTGLVNQGTMNFAGTTNILGDVTNSAGAKIISGGGGATIFLDDVVNNGEIRTSTNGFTVFYGSVSGSGTFTGTGTVNMEGDMTPGSSPASVTFEGDLIFGGDATLTIELGGDTLGTYDQILVDGELVLDGTLDVLWLPGFTASVGDSFNILDWGTLDGDFHDVDLPDLAPGLAWNQSQLYIDGTISVASGLPGDFDFDLDVDGIDFLIWQRGDSPNSGSADDLADWEAYYGTQPLVAASAAVPEPTTGAVLLVALIASTRFCRVQRAKSLYLAPPGL